MRRPPRRIVTLSVRGQKRRVGLCGEGPPLLLLHGFTGSLRSFDRVLPALALRRRTVAPEALGHGGSAVPEDPARLSLEEQAEDLAALLDRWALSQVDVAGYSMGGRLALAFALRHPQRVRRLVLEGASPGLAGEGERRARREADEALARLLEDEGLEAFLARWAAQPLFASQATLPATWRRHQERERRSHTAFGLAQSLRGAGTGSQPSYWDDLGHVAAPTLLLTGSLDRAFTERAREMARRLPRGTHRIVERAGHNVHLEAPREYLAAVLPVLELPP